MSLWPSLEWKTFLDGIKVNIYAYANKIVENNDFLNDFWHFLTDKAIKIQENWKILNKKSPFTQNFAKQPNFFFPKVLIIIFNP